MIKRAQLFFRNPCSKCEDTIKFLEENGVVVSTRNVDKEPLSKNELAAVLGHLNPKHYIDPDSPTYKNRRFNGNLPDRDELFNIIEENPDLLRHPIVVAGRLLTIGSNRQQLIDMLQLTVNGNGSGDQ